jgi:hypothetical protein
MKVGCSLSSWRQPSEGRTIQQIFSDLQDINLAVWNGPYGYQTENPFVYGCCAHRVQIVSASCLCVFRWTNLVRCLGPFLTACVSLRSGNLMIRKAQLQFYLMLSLQWNVLLLSDIQCESYIYWTCASSW